MNEPEESAPRNASQPLGREGKSSRFIAVALWLVLFLFVSLVSLSTITESGAETPWWLPGSPEIVLSGPHLFLDSSRSIRRLALEFDGELEQKDIRVSRADDNQVTLNRGRIVEMSPLEGEGYLVLPLVLTVDSEHNRLSEKRITRAFLGGAHLKLSEFYQDFMLDGKSNARYRNEFSLGNLSRAFSGYIGGYIPSVVIWLLAPLAVAQLILFFLSLTSFLRLDAYFRIENPWIDRITEVAAIPLGLLGTVSALWLAFEQLGDDLGDTLYVVRILSSGLFTTFLGLLAYGLMSFRGLMKRHDSA